MGTSSAILSLIDGETGLMAYVHHASREAPQYLIKSDKTEHVVIHKGAALRPIPPRARKSSRTTGTTRQEKR
jgi:hypothetical protein